MAKVDPLFVSPLVEVHSLCCTAGRSSASIVRGGEAPHLCLVRRGCFHYHFGGQTYLADSSRALIHDDGAEYRTSHPCDGGDDCTIILMSPELMQEAFGRRRPHEHIEFEMTPSGQVRHLAAYAGLSRRRGDVLEAEEAVAGLVRAIAGARVGAVGGEAGRNRIVQRAKALLNATAESNLSLEAIAAEAGCSPYHLMHLFRRQTGQTVRGYRARLRVAAALERMAQGDWDLTELALSCGFSSHSHLSGTFRSVLGMTPSEVRAQLGPQAMRAQGGRIQAALDRAA